MTPTSPVYTLTGTPSDILLSYIIGQNPGPTITIDGVVYETDKLAHTSDYWNAQPPAVVAMRAQLYMGNPASSSVATALAGAGYTIDTPIMVYGWDAMYTMWQRIILGLSSIPDWTNTKQIKTSVFLADYPSLVPPKPVAPPSPLVGELDQALTQEMGTPCYDLGVGVQYYNCPPTATAADGTAVTLIITRSLMGSEAYWKKAA